MNAASPSFRREFFFLAYAYGHRHSHGVHLICSPMDLQSIFEKFCAFGTGKAGVAEMDSFKVWAEVPLNWVLQSRWDGCHFATTTHAERLKYGK